MPLPSNSKKGADDLLESKLTKITDIINNNFVLPFDIKYQIYPLTAVAT